MCLAVPGRVISIEGEGLFRTARVDFGGLIKDINISLVDVNAGDYVLAHAGIAINRIDQAEAGRVFELLDQIDDRHQGESSR